jgi:hypothetical protein
LQPCRKSSRNASENELVWVFDPFCQGKEKRNSELMSTFVVCALLISSCTSFVHLSYPSGAPRGIIPRHLRQSDELSKSFKRRGDLYVAINPIEGDVQTIDAALKWSTKGVVRSGLDYKALANEAEDFPTAGAVRAGETE